MVTAMDEARPHLVNVRHEAFLAFLTLQRLAVVLHISQKLFLFAGGHGRQQLVELGQLLRSRNFFIFGHFYKAQILLGCMFCRRYKLLMDVLLEV